MSYVRYQFNRVVPLDQPTERPQIKVSTEHGATKWISIDMETLEEIRAVLMRNETELPER
jgi:hypothetical protein